jgi:hypothetical protein
MAAMRPRSLRRASRLLLVCAVALAHLVVFLMLSLNRPREPETRLERREIVAIIPLQPRRAAPLSKLGRTRSRTC